MELKLLCDCGQKYAFDVEPVNGQMPFVVNCPSCGIDGTGEANQMLTQAAPSASSSFKPANGLRLNAPVASAESHSAPPPLAVPVLPLRQNPIRPAIKKEKEYSFLRGVIGAVLGTILGIVIVVAFTVLTGIRFPLMGTLIGATTGWLARWMAGGTDLQLGVVAGAIAFLVTGGILIWLLGIFAIASIISLIVSASVAYKIAG
ncbi:MAG: hypothetical protein ABJC04_05930 [Verrucomicrobiota bacterium]